MLSKETDNVVTMISLANSVYSYLLKVTNWNTDQFVKSIQIQK